MAGLVRAVYRTHGRTQFISGSSIITFSLLEAYLQPADEEVFGWDE